MLLMHSRARTSLVNRNNIHVKGTSPVRDHVARVGIYSTT
jgi:hypothetical protein